MFQHYHRRNPPWIKLYRTLLDDRAWHGLDGDSAKALIMLWLIASENGGELPESDTDLAFRLRMTEAQFASVISKLSPWLTTDASNMLAPCYQHASPETETETETEAEAEAETEADLASSLRSEVKKGTRLPEDWQPSPGHLRFAESEGLTASEIEREAAKFRDYWVGRAGAGGVKRDWSATWRNWIRKSTEGRRNGRVQDDSKSATAAAKRLAELAERGRFTFGPRPSLLPAESGNGIRLLPEGCGE